MFLFKEFLRYFFVGISYKVTKVTTKLPGKPKMAKENGPKQHNKVFFCPKGKKSLSQSPPQELEVGLRSALYLFVIYQFLLLTLPSGIKCTRPMADCQLENVKRVYIEFS